MEKFKNILSIKINFKIAKQFYKEIIYLIEVIYIFKITK